MKFAVKSTVPTVYQSRSIQTLMGFAEKRISGAYTASVEFDTEEEAKDFLRGRLSVLFGETDMNEDQYNEAMDYIAKYGSLSYDAATARIEEVEVEETTEEE